MIVLDIDINMDDVVIEGQRVLRPIGVARSAWYEMWSTFGLTLSRHHAFEYPWTEWHDKFDT